LIRRQRDACAIGEAGADVMRDPVDRRGLAQFRRTRRRQHRDGQVSPSWPTDAGTETRRPARSQLGEFDGACENDYPAQHFAPADPLQRPAEHHPAAAQ